MITMPEIKTVQRFMIADYLNTGTSAAPVWGLCGAGYNSLDENPSAQTDTKIYINDKAATTNIKSYQTVFPFDTDLMRDQPTIMELYNIGRNHLTGGEAERDYVRVELFQGDETVPNVYPARKFRVAVSVDNFAGAGGETIKVSGNFNSVGDFVDGTFNIETREFTAADLTP